MLWGLLDVQQNSIDLVKLKGISKRIRRPLILTPDQVPTLLEKLSEPCRTMALVATCTGPRISEIVALHREDFDFGTGTLWCGPQT